MRSRSEAPAHHWPVASFTVSRRARSAPSGPPRSLSSVPCRLPSVVGGRASARMSESSSASSIIRCAAAAAFHQADRRTASLPTLVRYLQRFHGRGHRDAGDAQGRIEQLRVTTGVERSLVQIQSPRYRQATYEAVPRSQFVEPAESRLRADSERRRSAIWSRPTATAGRRWHLFRDRVRGQ